MTPGVSSSSRGETRTETQENVFVTKQVMMKSRSNQQHLSHLLVENFSTTKGERFNDCNRNVSVNTTWAIGPIPYSTTPPHLSTTTLWKWSGGSWHALESETVEGTPRQTREEEWVRPGFCLRRPSSRNQVARSSSAQRCAHLKE